MVGGDGVSLYGMIWYDTVGAVPAWLVGIASTISFSLSFTRRFSSSSGVNVAPLLALVDVDTAVAAVAVAAVADDDCLARDAAMARACSMALAVWASPGGNAGTRLPPGGKREGEEREVRGGGGGRVDGRC